MKIKYFQNRIMKLTASAMSIDEQHGHPYTGVDDIETKRQALIR
jgi:hypothetical protein